MDDDSAGVRRVPGGAMERLETSRLRAPPANAKHAFSALHQARPEVVCSTNPADYVLQFCHLNAEFKYDAARTELGWSMREAKITLQTE